MKGLDNQLFVQLLVISNLVAVLQLIAAVKWPRAARISFFLLFAWACWINLNTSQRTPYVYLDYANLTWSTWYRAFIQGWFAEHVKLAVGIVGVCQGLIAISMLLKGRIFQVGCAGAMLFLISIIPFGVGSGFPATAIMAIAIFVLLNKNSYTFVWKSYKRDAVYHT